MGPAEQTVEGGGGAPVTNMGEDIRDWLEGRPSQGAELEYRGPAFGLRSERNASLYMSSTLQNLRPLDPVPGRRLHCKRVFDRLTKSVWVTNCEHALSFCGLQLTPVQDAFFFNCLTILDSRSVSMQLRVHHETLQNVKPFTWSKLSIINRVNSQVLYK